MGIPYIFFLTAFCFVTLATAGIMGDECDWTGSGLASGVARGVTPVYLRCRAGRLTWLYPRGALRLILRLHNSNKDFKVCIKILPQQQHHHEDTEIDLYAEDEVLDFREDSSNFVSAAYHRPKNSSARFPARLFLEGSRGLVPLYAADDGSDKVVRCFRSKGGRAAVFVEAVPLENGENEKRSARLQYDLQPLPAPTYDPDAEECRPCTDQEMANAFCTKDLVLKGIIVGMRQRPELGTNEITVKLTKLIRYTNSEGQTFHEDIGAPHNSSIEYSRLHEAFTEEGTKKKAWHARVQTITNCGASPGPGEFLIAAGRRLGTLSLTCAPRADLWAEIAQRLNAKGSALCLLTT